MLLIASSMGAQSLLKIDATAVVAPSGCASTCNIAVFLVEAAPADAGNSSSWQVSASFSNPNELMSIPVTVSASGFLVTLTFDESALRGRTNPTWSIAYIGSRGPVLAPAPPNPAGPPKTPKSRAEADIYVSGTFLAGLGSKPLYLVDAKVNILRPIPRKLTRLGFAAEMLTNTGTELPVNRTEADPDSIRAAFSLEGVRPGRLGPFNGLLWNLKPAGGEFTRKHPTSNFVADANLRFSVTPGKLGAAWYTIYPMLGFEGGHNLNKPAVLFKRPVNLDSYNGILRAVTGIEGALGIYVKNKEPKVLLSGSYTLRTPFTDEPFTTLDYVTGSSGTTERAKVVRMRRNARPFSRNALVWNLNDAWSIALEHKFGSLPPLFEQIRHQVSIGLVYRRNLAGKPSF